MLLFSVELQEKSFQFLRILPRKQMFDVSEVYSTVVFFTAVGVQFPCDLCIRVIAQALGEGIG